MKKTLLAVVVGLVLTGCGGGGDDDKPSIENPKPEIEKPVLPLDPLPPTVVCDENSTDKECINLDDGFTNPSEGVTGDTAPCDDGSCLEDDGFTSPLLPLDPSPIAKFANIIGFDLNFVKEMCFDNWELSCKFDEEERPYFELWYGGNFSDGTQIFPLTGKITVAGTYSLEYDEGSIVSAKVKSSNGYINGDPSDVNAQLVTSAKIEKFLELSDSIAIFHTEANLRNNSFNMGLKTINLTAEYVLETSFGNSVEFVQDTPYDFSELLSDKTKNSLFQVLETHSNEWVD